MGARRDARYSPFDLVSPGALGLKREVHSTDFGQLVTWVGGTAGDGDLLTVFLHGVGGSSRAWTPLLRAATESGQTLGHTLLIDLPGFGESENRNGALDATEVSRVILKVAKKASPMPIVLVGHSMGGYLALHAASLNEISVRGVMAISGTYLSIIDATQDVMKGMRDSPNAVLAFEAMRALAVAGPASKYALGVVNRLHLLPRIMSKTVAHPSLMTRTFFDAVVENLRPRSFVQAAQNGKRYDPLSTWSQISVPSLVTFADQDGLVSTSDRARVVREFDTFHVLDFEDCGHFAPIERPHAVLDAVIDFIEKNIRGW